MLFILQKSHTKQKDHACQLCGKKFLYSYNVRAHIRYVHEGQKRNFSCRICEYKCKSGNVLKNHYKDIHSVIEMIEDFE
jgi:KRAB domain-containing zinc finger protein